MPTMIVYVHGNGNKVRAEMLKQQWDQALFGQDMGSSSRMAYWAPLRYPQPLPDTEFDEIEEMPDPGLEGVPPPVADPETFVAETVQEAEIAEGTLEGVDDPGEKAKAASLEEWLRAMTYTAEALADGDASNLEALPLPRPLRVAAFRELVRRTFKDVHAYFFGGFREAMRDVLRNELRGVGGPVVVVGHSLGSIIAYDVLRTEPEGAHDVRLLTTIGSPLGVLEIQDLVERPLEVPTGIPEWRNASDARDLVALDHTIRPEYAPAARCRDVMVVNDSMNHHGAREYLGARDVREPIVALFDN